MRNHFTILCAALLAAGATAMAADTAPTYKLITGGYGQVFGMSTNNKYVTVKSLDEANPAPGIWEFAKQDAFTPFSNPEITDASLYGITDDGTAVGFTETDAIVVSLDGTVKVLPVPEDTEVGGVAVSYTAFCYGVTADGKTIVGVVSDDNYNQQATIWRDGKYEFLPLPTVEEAGFEYSGSRADLISADGKVIAGALIDDMSTNPVIIWTLQDDGTYKYDYLAKDYFATSMDDTTSPLIAMTLSNQQGGMSPNGEWLSLTVVKNSMDFAEMIERPARFNLATRTLTIHPLTDMHEDLDETAAIYASGISNDGTLVGFTDDNTQRVGIIWKSDSEQMMPLKSLYPELADYDDIANTVTGISGDARYIYGFGEKAVGEGVSYDAYVLDTKYEGTGIGSVESSSDSDTVTGVYNLSGTRVGNSTEGLAKGLYIVTKASGKATKIMVK